MGDFLEDFAKIFIGITLVLAYLAAGLFIIVAPFVYIGHGAGAVLGIFDALVFVSLTITIGEYM